MPMSTESRGEDNVSCRQHEVILYLYYTLFNNITSGLKTVLTKINALILRKLNNI